MICARYARLSKKGRRQDDKAASIERQLQDAERFTVEHDLGAVTGTTVYAEPEGTSGAAYGIPLTLTSDVDPEEAFRM